MPKNTPFWDNSTKPSKNLSVDSLNKLRKVALMPTKPSDNQRKKPAGVRAWGIKRFGRVVSDTYRRKKTAEEIAVACGDGFKVVPVLITELPQPARKKRA